MTPELTGAGIRAAASLTSPRGAHASAQPYPTRKSLAKNVLSELWVRMGARYGHRWTSQYEGDDSDEGRASRDLALAEWGMALAGLERTDLTVGLRADVDRGDDWPPSAPAFARMCRGIPVYAALRFEMTHPEVPRTSFGLLCWHYVDPFALRQADRREADRLRREAYELACVHVMRGGELPEVHAALAQPDEPERTPASEATARAALEKMRRLFEAGDDGTATDAPPPTEGESDKDAP